MRVTYRINLHIDTDDYIATLEKIDDVLQDGLDGVDISLVTILKTRLVV